MPTSGTSQHRHRMITMADFEERLRRIFQTPLLKEAVTATHERLKADLHTWAAERGYDEVYKALPSGGEPTCSAFRPTGGSCCRRR